MNFAEKSWLAFRRELMICHLKLGAVPVGLVALAGLGLLAGLALAAKPAYRMLREYRLDQTLAAARTADHLHEWSAARDKAHCVLLVHRDNFEAYRIWTRALGQLGEPCACMAAAQLLADARASRRDRLESLQLLVRQAPQALALSAYDRLPKPLRDEAAFRAVMIPLLLQRGESDLAESGLREVAAASGEPALRLEWLRALCSHPTAKRVAEARRTFASLVAARADTAALAALAILGATPGGLAPGAVLPDLPAWLDSAASEIAQGREVWLNESAASALIDSDPAARARMVLYEGGPAKLPIRYYCLVAAQR